MSRQSTDPTTERHWWDELPLKISSALLYSFATVIAVVALLGILGKLPF